jgi:predicted DNA-binding transcriptional regulator AlpA
MQKIQSEGFLRLKHIVGCPEQNIEAIIPVSKSSWWAGIKTGRYPKGIKLGKRTTVWKKSDILNLVTAS